MTISNLYLHKVLNKLSLSQLRQLAGEFKMDSSGSKSQLISRLINPMQIGGALEEVTSTTKQEALAKKQLLSAIKVTTPKLVENASISTLEKLSRTNKEYHEMLKPILDLAKWLVTMNKISPNMKLSELKSLDLRGTPLQSLPDSIGNLSKLEWLALRDTQLESLPDSIGNLSKLKWLYLSNTPLKSLPDSIGNLSNLEMLYLSETKLKSLPDSIGNLSNLERLALRDTQLESLPDSIGTLSKLKGLWLSGTKLELLPDSIGALSKLETLDLGGTKLKSLPDSIEALSNLEYLDLRGTQLQSLPVVQRLRDRGVTIYT